MPKHSRDIMVVGRSCRLPGAASVDELWQNLIDGRCSVGTVPPDRWSQAKHGHPRQREPGKSYVWSAGVLDSIWDFDPSVFGLSPREAEQMDPQQRLMLELTWEALEDAGIRRQDVAGTDVGVFIGASSTEYQTIRSSDAATMDGYSATGGALSIISNRVSYAFDLHGPSFTVDTACSSSLVALHQAMSALRAGTIDTAIVGGVNVLLSPYGFVLFSQASMLSPNGLCRTFDAKADGYVRAEGGVVLVLQSAARATRDKKRIHGRLVASGVNSDGRTNGIALPSRKGQERLLRDIYRRAGIAPDDVAFVEAHGTGTRVGDPIEASVIGDVLGTGRSAPLPLGSIKSNIGHLEPGSGLAGVLKAMLALEHDTLPPSVNFETPNPDIDFEGLNIAVCTAPTALPRRAKAARYAGVNSFGFGGTNAHVVLADPPPPATSAAPASHPSDLFAFSAASQPALRDMARLYAERLASASFDEAREVVAAAAHQRELMPERAVIEWASPRALVRKLEAVADKEAEVQGLTRGTVTEAEAKVCFVFSGNGGQWSGMGRSAYATNRRFRETFDEIDAIFDADFGWSVTEALFAEDLEQQLRLTSIAQPLIFATQIAVARALRAEGLDPALTIGHSVGEIAAAAESGALSLREAVAVIQARSSRQEMARDMGRMAVVAAPREQVEQLCKDIGGVSIAAENSARAFTVAGLTDAIDRVLVTAKQRRIVARKLDLDYPFHCWLIDPVRAPLMTDLAGLKGSPPTIPMISTVTGEPVEGRLDADYWWRNIREPVRFAPAIERAVALGARVFVEIGPRSILLGNIKDVTGQTGFSCAALGVLERHETPEKRDTIRPAVLSAFTRGARISLDKLFGPKPVRAVSLPHYPWNRREFRPVASLEAVGSTLTTGWHALLGAREVADGLEWTGMLDSALLPELADHEVGGQAILPGAAFLEIALAAARQWFGSEQPALLELDIVQPLPIEKERSRELKCRFSPVTGTLEILSRPRMSRVGWTSHALAHLTKEPADLSAAAWPTGAEPFASQQEIYRAAESVGLRYGPAFRQLRSVGRMPDDRLTIDLLPTETADPRYGIDPARLDACFHGLFSLFGALDAAGRGTAYIPVRFGPTRLIRPGAILARAAITITRASEGSILADFALFDEAGQPIAEITDARFQAARIQRVLRLADKALIAEAVALDTGSAGHPGSPIGPDLIREATGEPDADLRTADQLLLEGWASAAGLRILHDLAEDGILSRERLARLDPRTASWTTATVEALARDGLVTETETGWALAEKEELPEATQILATLAADHPERSAELLLAGRLGAWNAAEIGAEAPPLSQLAIDGFDLGGIGARAAGERLEKLLDTAGLFGLAKTGLRVLQIGFGPLSFALTERTRAMQARLTLLDLDPRRIERAKLALDGGHVDFLAALPAEASGAFDIIVAAEGLLGFRKAGGSIAALSASLAPGGLLAAIEPAPSLFRDLVFGLAPGWFDDQVEGPAPSPIRLQAEWVRDLSGAGFADLSVGPVGTAAGEAILICAAGAVAEPAIDARSVLIRNAADTAFAGAIGTVLAAEGHDVRLIDGMPALVETPAKGTVLVAVFDTRGHADSMAALTEGALQFTQAAELASRLKTELWTIVATRSAEPETDPVATGLLAFARTLSNENAAIAIRRIALADDLGPERAAAAVATLLRRAQVETDFTIRAEGASVLRFLSAEEAERSETGQPDALKLERGTAGGLTGLTWQPTKPAEPKDGEIEILVEATGLNFRDVMWAMSLLPDDILEDGFAGPTLGLECSGRVGRIGRGVTRFRTGDRVLAFAPSAFSTSVAVPEGVAMPVPEHWSTESAAGVPVAFLTAYYGLVTMAALRPGEWVLIHGAAGGVGLAAIQIAKWRGATVVATAGSREKRDLLTALGADHVLNSRSTGFADDIRRLRRRGVDVVLNSLSAEAMERSIAALAPFGRFVELGKRDYVANTRIGLRPFKRNLSYFGVDVDQLLSNEGRAGEIFAEIMRLFDDGTLTPLPYRVFGTGETLDAFRLMQQSGHIGKILLRPPSQSAPVRPSTPFVFDPRRTHLVTGGFGGFGLETARWLADRGVRHMALLGRSGAQSDEAKALVAELQARDVDIRAFRCDVASEAALTRTLQEIRRTMPPLAGVLHAAMVLEDGLTNALTADQLSRVLGPKVVGADLLDRLTAGMALDYFAMFSSITTFIGNPGQGAYVAANGYLEGLARARRARGLPGHAFAWGAISDVGVLARKKGLAEALAKRVGVVGMPAREALELMAQALADRRPDSAAVMAVGSLDWNAARRLPALSSPTFSGLIRDGSGPEGSERPSIDLRELVQSQPAEQVRKTVVDVIVEEIATVLRVPRQDVVPTKRLGELGLDSLMAIELASALQDRLGLDDPPAGAVGALTTIGLADQIIALVSSGAADEDSQIVQALNERHGGAAIDTEALAPIMKVVVDKARDVKGLTR